MWGLPLPIFSLTQLFSFWPACVLKENTPSYKLLKYNLRRKEEQVAEPNQELTLRPQGMSGFCVPPLFRACASVQRAELCPLVSLRFSCVRAVPCDI